MAYRLQNLSESMLALSLAQKDELSFERINLCAVLENIQKAYCTRAKEENISLTVNCGKDIFIEGESSLIESLVGNLVDNAFNACKADQAKHVHSVNLSVAAADNTAVISVQDNGIGMDEKTLEKIHTPFYRQDKARSRKNGGAGLGGSIVKKIADVHGAKIEYSSALGKGTTAKVIFTTC